MPDPAPDRRFAAASAQVPRPGLGARPGPFRGWGGSSVAGWVVALGLLGPQLGLLLVLHLGLVACGPAPADDPGASPGQASGHLPPPASAALQADFGADFEALRNEAFQLMDAGAPEEQVLAALRRAHAANPLAYGVNARLGTLLSDARHHAEALEHWRVALEARPDELLARREVAALAVSLGQAELTLAVVAPLLADPAMEGDGRMLKARALDDLGRRAEALAALEGCEHLPPDAAGPALSLWGQLLLEGGDAASARQRFAAALSARPDDQAAVRGLADTSRRLGDATVADRWDEVLQLMIALGDNFFVRHHDSPEDRKVQRQAGRQSEYIARELARRDERLRRLLELHAEWPEAWVQLADVLRQQGDDAGACEVIDQALARFGDVLDGPALRERFCDG